ncbi:MAG: hypothetical protein N3F07_00715 [Candidatus Micrarchaeota archaeon]|nr:hypothetical protein [Candidatus Micrarchaeota archaeon]
MPQESKTVHEIRFPIELKGKSFPKLDHLSSLGFDSIQQTRSSCLLSKIDSRDMHGNPLLFCQIKLDRNEASAKYSCPEGCHPQSRRLRAAILLLRCLRLVPNLKASASEASAALLPSLEFSERFSLEPYESLLQKIEVLSSEQKKAQLQRQRLIAEAERCSFACASLEKENEALKARVKQLEAVSDRHLQELLLEWVASHQGAISLPKFSAANNIPIARCEEGLALLLRKGILVELPGKLEAAPGVSHERLLMQKKSVLGKIQLGLSSLASSIFQKSLEKPPQQRNSKKPEERS